MPTVLASGSIGRVYSKNFGLLKSKRIYKVGEDGFFCERHDNRLSLGHGQRGYGHTCDFCGVKFGKLPENQ